MEARPVLELRLFGLSQLRTCSIPPRDDARPVIRLRDDIELRRDVRTADTPQLYFQAESGDDGICGFVRYHLTDITSGQVEVHTRLRRCGELGYVAAQDLVQLSPGKMKVLYKQAVTQMPDYHLTLSFAYNRGGTQIPSLALQWRSGVRVNAEGRRYAGTEADHDPTGQRVYGFADALAGDVFNVRVSNTLAFFFGSAEWEDELYNFYFDLSSSANIERLAGEPVSVLVRNSHGILRSRAFSFASFK